MSVDNRATMEYQTVVLKRPTKVIKISSSKLPLNLQETREKLQLFVLSF